MSRGSEVRKVDEQCAVYSIGSAINMAAIDQMPSYDGDYDRARNGVTEEMSFVLRDLVNNKFVRIK